jgi:hypothetical protein
MSDETTPQDDKAMPPASAGSHWPAAWMTEDGNYFTSKANTARAWRGSGLELVPLYLHHPQVSPSLTEAEQLAIARALGSAARERISVVADWAAEHLGQDDPGVVALRALMERLK